MTKSPPPVSLDYVSTFEHQASRRIYRIALICGMAPMSGGLLILLLFWLTRAEIFVGLGMLMLLVGGIVTVAGFVASMIYLASAFSATVDRKNSLRGGLLSLLLVLLNVPVAGFCVHVGGYLALSSVVATFTIKNSGTIAVDRGTLYQARHKVNFGSIPPGGSVSVRLPIESHGPIYAEVFRHGLAQKEEVYGDTDEDNFRGGYLSTINVLDNTIDGAK